MLRLSRTSVALLTVFVAIGLLYLRMLGRESPVALGLG